MPRFVRSVLVLLALLPCLAGCEKISRVSECRKLAATVSRAMDAIEVAGKANSAAGYRAAAKRYQELAKEVRQTRFKTSVGQGAIEEYALALESVAPPVITYAEALEKGNARGQAEARREIERVGRREHAASSRVDALCRAP